MGDTVLFILVPNVLRITAILLAVVVMTASGAPQEPIFSVKVNAPLVTVDVSVSDSRGNVVTNLTRDEFQVYEDGRLQSIQSFEPVEAPYSLLLLFDCSGSTQEMRGSLEDAFVRLVQKLRPQDRVAVAPFGGKVHMLVDWASRRHPLDKATSAAVCNSGTDFYGAVTWAVQNMKDLPGRRGVIVLTDGQDTSMPTELTSARDFNTGQQIRRIADLSIDAGFQKLLKAVRESAMPVYLVAVNTDRNPVGAPISRSALPDFVQIRMRIEQLAKGSGGRVVFPRNPRDVVPMYEQIGKELGTSFSLGYAPEVPLDDGKHHKIEVRLKSRNLKVRQSRDGYSAASPASTTPR